MAITSSNNPWVKYFKNFYILTGVVFLVWMIFFDNDNFFKRHAQKNKEQDLKNQELYYKDEIVELESKMRELKSNNEALEKFAREKYLLHKKGEDVYVIKETED
ncbi:septum formation initiator family protein [Flammeovirga sp. MY04]|uniref:FtsB family cell division protein n=1 Tax=Flammeovirga sp. MY04 TaxID=1191459 RepID=UPI0008060953|nr:septum formation initiator family protein [Flammeovirga sp. MY04]ANQ49763.1 septum formation initiator family protein [Flammeovirga sp. MY04]